MDGLSTNHVAEVSGDDTEVIPAGDGSELNLIFGDIIEEILSGMHIKIKNKCDNCINIEPEETLHLSDNKNSENPVNCSNAGEMLCSDGSEEQNIDEFTEYGFYPAPGMKNPSGTNYAVHNTVTW